ncbi:hypothetical protein LJB98_00065 [Bacteroidales bacterium OttesenSCG-928-M11]|nr:hypothetical protein [Bacteroidales bacterium OttesenSCG-928-M11]
MKKVLLFSVLFIFTTLSSNAFAQNDSDNKRKESFEKFKKERRDYIVKEVGLTEDEAETFLPLCDELQIKKFEAGKDLREMRHKIRENSRNGNKTTEAEYEKLVKLNASVKVKEAELEKEYIDKFLTVVSSEKVYRYQRAEQEFARKMVEQRSHKDRR